MMAGRTKRKIAKAYDALGGRIYDLRYAEEQESKYKMLLERIPPETSDVTLDVGCGTGLLLNRLRSRNVGVDLSPALLSASRMGVGARPNNELVQADAENLPFRDATFHKIYSVTLIQNTPNPEKAIVEMKRISRRGSKLAITALKKGFTEDQFISLFESIELEPVEYVFDEDLKDWIALVL
jgi:ubiquinone/menaquinone biosynthesis C-methylase UbiE